jgi:hypothetical protein
VPTASVTILAVSFLSCSDRCTNTTSVNDTCLYVLMGVINHKQQQHTHIYIYIYRHCMTHKIY